MRPARKILIISIGLGLFLFGCHQDDSRPRTGRTAEIAVDTVADVADPPFDDGKGGLEDLPGADGKVSLREAMVAAGNSGRPVKIAMAPYIDGSVVMVRQLLPELRKSDLTIDGMINPVGKKLVLDLSALSPQEHGIQVKASRITLQNLVFRNFSFDFQDPQVRAVIAIHGEPPSRPPLSEVTVADCEFTGRTAYGIALAFGNQRDIQILNNRMTFTGLSRSGIAVSGGMDGYEDRVIEKVVVAGNEISGSVDIPILLMGSASGGRRNEIRNLKVRHNQIHDIVGGVRDRRRCFTICPTSGRDFRTEQAVIRDVTLEDNYCHDVVGGYGLWIMGGVRDSEHGNLFNLRVARNRFVNTAFGINVVDQLEDPGPGGNWIELMAEDNLFDTNLWAVIISKGTGDLKVFPSTLVLDLGGGQLGSRGRNLFLNSKFGLHTEPRPDFTLFARNNYWGDPSGPSDRDPLLDADGIPDPSGAGTAVSENIYWSPFLATPP